MVLPLIAGVLIFIRSAGRDPFERVLLALLAPAMGIALWVMCFCIVDFGVDDWSGAKLAPIVAMVHGQPQGYPLYQDPPSGVMTGWIYGPASALMFLPATAFNRPTPALLCGSMISLLCTILPAIWIHIQFSRTNWLAGLLGICLFLILCISHESLRLALFQIGPDGPALGFAACSIALLIDHRGRWIRLIPSALLASLSVWSKQSLLPFLCVAPIYLAICGEWKTAIRLVMLTAASLGVLSLVFVAAFGPLSAMWFHMIRLPASHSWVADRPELMGTLIGIFGELLNDCSNAGAILLLVLLISRPVARNRSNAWIIFVMAAAVGIPGAVFGYVKVGGDINNFALTGYFLSLAVTVLLTQTLVLLELPDRLGVLLRSGSCLVVIAVIGLMASNPGKLQDLPRRLADPNDNSQEFAFRFLKLHPDAAYFPWNPLAAVLAQGKLYHFEWGMIDRFLGDPASVGPEHAGHLLAHMPPETRVLAIPFKASTTFCLRYFPKFAKAAPSPDLPGFIVYTTPAATQPGDPAQ